MPASQILKDRTATKIVFVYIFIGCLWILLSDRAILWLDGERQLEKITYFQTYKGCFFVVVTGLLLYLLIHRGVSEVKQTEYEKQEAGRRYSELVENANDIVYTLDTSGRFISINRAGELITGYPAEELLEKNLTDIISSEHQKYVSRLLTKAVKENHSVYEIELLKKDGGKVLVEISSRPVYREDELAGMQGIARDVTARRAVEMKLKESETRNREFLETTNEGVLITDEEGIITFINKKMADMLDYDPAEILDNYASDFMDDEFRREAGQKFKAQESGMKETFDIKFKTFDGDDLWTIVSSKPLFEENKYVGSISMVTDITKRKLAEESLKIEQKINNATIASLPGIFYFYDDTGKFLRWNENFELVSGYTGEEIAQMHPLDFFENREKKVLEEKIEEVFEKGEAYIQAHFLSKDGTTRPYFFTGKQLKLDGKRYLIGTGIDLTNFKVNMRSA